MKADAVIVSAGKGLRFMEGKSIRVGTTVVPTPDHGGQGERDSINVDFSHPHPIPLPSREREPNVKIFPAFVLDKPAHTIPIMDGLHNFATLPAISH